MCFPPEDHYEIRENLMWKVHKKQSSARMKQILSESCIFLKKTLGLTFIQECQIGNKKKTIIGNIHKEITTAIKLIWSNALAFIRHDVAKFIRLNSSDDSVRWLTS